jgi:hypothetical protein
MGSRAILEPIAFLEPTMSDAPRDKNASASREEMARRLGLPDPEAVRKQRESSERTHTTAEVKAYLKSLENKG